MADWKRIGTFAATGGLSGLSKQNRADAKKLAQAAKRGLDHDGEKQAALSEIRQEARRIEEQSSAQARERKNERSRMFQSQAVYEGGAPPLADIKVGAPWLLRLNPTGIELVGALRRKVMAEIGWDDVIGVDVSDASRTEIKSGVRYADAGSFTSILVLTNSEYEVEIHRQITTKYQDCRSRVRLLSRRGRSQA